MDKTNNWIIYEGNEKPTRTLYVKGFVRPFTNSAVKEFFSQDGEITFLWMDKIKTHCYVSVKFIYD